MKDRRILIIIALAIIIIMIIIAILINIKNNKVEEFRLSDYQEEIDSFTSNIIFGEVLDSTTAKKLTEKIWKEDLGESVKEWKPFKVFFDEEHRVWLIIGTLGEGLFGGEIYTLIRQQDGKVLAAWYTQ